MLFTSWTFLFAFLPVALLGFGAACRMGPRAGAAWLVLASFVFYGFFQPSLVLLLSASIAFNYSLSLLIRRNAARPQLQTLLLIAGVSVNVGALFYFKYAYPLLLFFFHIYGQGGHGFRAILLPLGISFFTFTQIGYLVDCKSEPERRHELVEYILFVTFFPHLIAGPILHHSEMMPQFANREIYRLRADNIVAGLSMFTLGLLKKSLIADNLTYLNHLGFANAGSLQLIGAWGSALGYVVQLYFDFSGYSDMAIGLAMMFNLRFPANFDSPLRATSIIDYWQRWHMTLTRYLNTYLYNPIALALRRRRMAKGLPMSRKALQTPAAFTVLIAGPTIVTMGLAGIWHGAGLQFLIFGLVHGVYITINNAWRLYGPKKPAAAPGPGRRRAVAGLACLVTFLAVTASDVIFRSDSVQLAGRMLLAMVGAHGIEYPLTVSTTFMKLPGHVGQVLQRFGLVSATVSELKLTEQAFYVGVGLLIIFLCPNSQSIMARSQPVLGKIRAAAPQGLTWRLSAPWSVAMGLAAVLALLSLGGTTEFLYFQF